MKGRVRGWGLGTRLQEGIELVQCCRIPQNPVLTRKLSSGPIRFYHLMFPASRSWYR